MVKHQQHYYEQDSSKESWTCNHFVLPHDIYNAMDMYVNLEYKHHQDVATSVRLWADVNPNKVFFFQQKTIASTTTMLSIKIQIVSQRKLMVDLGNQRVVKCDVTFRTNDKKVL
jgi:hypothetical protein